MIIKTCFTKVTLFSIDFGRRAATWIAQKYNVGKVVFASNSHLATPVGSSVYGVLVSGDTARHWL